MATLTGNTIASTYTGILSVSGAVGTDTVEAVTDGAGTSTSLSLSQQRATITLGSNAGDDFIVDGTTLVVEGDNNRVGIGTNTPSELLHLKSSTSTKPVLRIENANADNLPPYINLVKSTTDEADSDYLGVIGFKGQNSASEEIEYAFISAQSTDVSDGTEDGRINFGTMKNRASSGATASTNMVLNGSNLGIGTTDPSTMLEIEGAIEGVLTAITLHNSDYDSTTSQTVQAVEILGAVTGHGSTAADMGSIRFGKDSNYANTTSARDGHILFLTSLNGTNSEKMRITSEGKVGIGATSPAEVGLTIASGTGGFITLGRDDVNDAITSGEGLGAINFDGTENSGTSWQTGAQIKGVAHDTWADGSAHGSQLIFSTTDAGTPSLDPRMCIYHNGNVGIGTTSPDSNLEISSSDDTRVKITDTGDTSELILRVDGSNTSIHTNTNHDLNLFTNGNTNQLFLKQSDGNVGIGTASPDSNLEISSSDDARIKITDTGDSSELLLRSDGGNTSIYTSTSHDLNLYTNGNANQLFLKQSNGYVGIGENDPEAMLHIVGSVGLIIESTDDAADVNGALITMANDNQSSSNGTFRYEDRMADQNNPSFIWNVADTGSDQVAYNFLGGDASRLSILQSGRVAINDDSTSAHVAQFTVKNSNDSAQDAFKVVNDNGNKSTIISQDATGNGQIASYTNAGANTVLFRSDANSHIINKLGLGHDTPTSELHIKKTTGGISIYSEALALSNTHRNEFMTVGKKPTGGTTPTDAYAGIGVVYNASPSGGTDQTVGFVRLDRSNGNNIVMWADDSGFMRIDTAYANAGTTGGTVIGEQTTSDERLKNISSDAFPYGLTEINKLKPIKYTFKSNTTDTKLGFGAQTTKDIIPESVYNTNSCVDGHTPTMVDRKDDDGKVMKDKDGKAYKEKVSVPNSDDKSKLVMEYKQIIPVLVKAVQELSAKVTALESK